MIYIYIMNIIMTKEKINIARQHRLQGKSPKEIANLLGVSIKLVYQYTPNLGVQPHHPLYKTNFIQHDFFSVKNIIENPMR